MRAVLIPLVLGLSVGCSSDAQFNYQSTLYSPTRGIVFQDDSSAQGGMGGNTCQIDVGSGMIGNDVDVASEDDVVLDIKDGLVLVGGTDGVHIYQPGDFGFDSPVSPERPVTGVIAASFVDTGIVSVSHAGQGLSIDWGTDQQIAMGGQGAASVAVNGSTGQVYVAQDSSVTVNTPEGSEILTEGDLVVWDSTAQVLYVANLGGTEVRGLEADGSERFVTPVSQPIVDLSALGFRGAVAVMTGNSSSGSLVIIDAEFGTIVSETMVPEAAQSISTSESGDSLAFQLPQAVHFYKLSSF